MSEATSHSLQTPVADPADVESQEQIEEEETKLTMHKAAQSGQLDELKSMLEANGNDRSFLKAKDSEGHTVTHWAAQAGKSDVMQWLIDHEAPLDEQSGDKTGMCPLHWAATRGHLNCAHILIQAGARVDGFDKSLCTPLLIAAQYGHPLLVTYLVKAGADVQAKDKENDTALHWAAYKGNVEIVSLFLALGLSCEVCDNYGQTPLHLAAMMGSLAACELLIEVVEESAPQVFKLTDKNGKTPAALAYSKGNPRIATIINTAENGKWYECWNILGTSKLQIPFLFVWFQIALGWLSFPTILMPCPAVQQSSELLPVALVSNLCMVYFLLRTYFTEPGYVQREGPHHQVVTPFAQREYEELLDNVAASGSSTALGESVLCHTCQVARPLRSKHCRVIKRCVLEYDHYCPFVNNCVGMKNYAYFYGYVLSHTVSTGLQVFFAAQVLWSDESMAGCGNHWGDWWVWALALDALFFMMMGGGMLIPHTWMVATNVTTNESINWRKYKHFTDPVTGKYRNPFHKGLVNNVLRRLCLIGDDSSGGKKNTVEKEGLISGSTKNVVHQ